MISDSLDWEAFKRLDARMISGLERMTIRDVVDVLGWQAVELFVITASPGTEDRRIIKLLAEIRDELRKMNG